MYSLNDPQVMALYMSGARDRQFWGLHRQAALVGERESRLCGDMIRISIRMDRSERPVRIRELRYENAACLVADFSSFVLADILREIDIDKTREIIALLCTGLKNHRPLVDTEIPNWTRPRQKDLVRALGRIIEYPIRVKCALLPWELTGQLLTSIGRPI